MKIIKFTITKKFEQARNRNFVEFSLVWQAFLGGWKICHCQNTYCNYWKRGIVR